MPKDNERRYAVLVTFGTLSWKMPYCSKSTLEEARALRLTAKAHGYDDAEVVENYDPHYWQKENAA